MRQTDMRAMNDRNNNLLADAVAVADTFLSRLRGLLGRKSLPSGQGLWIKPCNSVHTFGMQFSIDVLFLDKGHRVVAIREEMAPNRLTRMYAGAATVLELPAGTARASATKAGDTIALR